MKFRWVPWYRTTFEVDETKVDFMRRVKTFVCCDDLSAKTSDYIGDVDGDVFRIFFRRLPQKYSLIQIKEFQTSYSTILWGRVVERGEKCKIEIIYFSLLVRVYSFSAFICFANYRFYC